MFGTIISTLITVIVIFYIWSDISNIKIEWRKVRTWLLIVIMSALALINLFVSDMLFKALNITLICIFVYKYLFKTRLKEALAIPIVIELMFLISEAIFAIVIFSIFKDGTEAILNNFIGGFIVNISTATSVLIFSKFKFIRKTINWFSLIIEKQDEGVILFMSIMTIFVYSIFSVNALKALNPKILMFMSIFISLTSFVLVCLFFKVKDDYYKVCDKYNSSLLSLKELEKVLSDYRVDNHENKNHLLTIRNMTKNKKVTTFIDSILDNKLKDNQSIMHETSIIPSGGLRGLVYSKMLVMENKNIDCELDVAKAVRTIELLDYGEDTMLDICKIVGIFLDNAIEEVDNLEDKYIIIEMFVEHDIFTISITNTFDNTKEKDNIYKIGFSTKGGSHGYGLSLVRKIIGINNKLKTHHEITNNEFTQILEIYK